jgi:hypothetical protein
MMTDRGAGRTTGRGAGSRGCGAGRTTGRGAPERGRSGGCCRSTRTRSSRSTCAATSSWISSSSAWRTAWGRIPAPCTSATATTVPLRVAGRGAILAASRRRSGAPSRSSFRARAHGTGSAPSGSIGTWRTPGSPPRRVPRYLGRDADVLHPSVELERFHPGGGREHYLMVAELMPHSASTSPSTRSPGSAGRWSWSATGPSGGACAASPGRPSCNLRRRRAAVRDRALPLRAGGGHRPAAAAHGSARRLSAVAPSWNEPSRVRWVTPQRKIPAFAIHFLISA